MPTPELLAITAEVPSTGMLIVAAIGPVVNLIAMKLLSAGKNPSLNVKGAYLEVCGYARLCGGLSRTPFVIMLAGWDWVDPLVAIAIGLWASTRLMDTTRILLEGLPAGLKLPEVRAAIAAVPGIQGVHDLHVRSVSCEDSNLSVHVEIAPAADAETVRTTAAAMLRDRFDLRHANIQTEREACEDLSGGAPLICSTET